MKVIEKSPRGWLFPLRIFVFWLLFFGLFRVVFLLRNSPNPPVSDAWLSLRNAFVLDASMAAWAAVVPIVLWVFALFLPKNGFKMLGFWLSRFFIAAFVIMELANILLYKEWSAVLNRRAISYLKSPRTMLDSMSNGQLLGSLVAIIFCWLFFGKLFDRLVAHRAFFCEKLILNSRILAAIVTPLLTFLALRGSVGQVAVNESAVYLSENTFTNHASVNPIWHLAHDLVEKRATSNPYVFCEKETAQQYISALFPADTASQKKLKLGETNVVVLVMESMAAQMFDDSARTPNLHELSRGGVLFSNVYGSGFRTDQGIVAVLSGYPAQPDQSILMLTDKAEKLPSLPRFFDKNHYSTLFCYGGDLTFANLGMYLRNQQFKKIISELDFTLMERSQRWGVDDARLLERFGRELDALKPPFFATGLTLSLHPPFDIPNDAEIGALSKPDKFRRAAVFADRAIGDFFKKNASKPWFANTIFVVVADHGGALPNEIPIEQAAARRIPLIFFGKNLPMDFDKKTLDIPGCQHDISATVLSLFGAQTADFQWSRNLFSNNMNGRFAYWSNEQSIGWHDLGGISIYDFTEKKWKTGEPKPAALGYLQALYTDFLAK